MSSIYYVLVFLIVWSIFCRARKMDQETPKHVKAQHGIVLILTLGSLPIFGFHEWASELLGAAVCVYLWIDSRNWRYRDSGGPKVISDADLRRVIGRGPYP